MFIVVTLSFITRYFYFGTRLMHVLVLEELSARLYESIIQWSSFSLFKNHIHRPHGDETYIIEPLIMVNHIVSEFIFIDGNYISEGYELERFQFFEECGHHQSSEFPIQLILDRI
jgi:hypothetical protein